MEVSVNASWSSTNIGTGNTQVAISNASSSRIHVLVQTSAPSADADGMMLPPHGNITIEGLTSLTNYNIYAKTVRGTTGKIIVKPGLKVI